MPAITRTAPLMLCLALCGAWPALAQQPAVPAPGATPSAPASVNQREGTFKAVQGEVTVVRGNVRSAAVVGAPVQMADRLVTGSRSAASLTLRDGTVLSVGPDSVVDVASFHYNATTDEGDLSVALLRGSLRMVTGLIAKLAPGQVKVTTPTTVIGVRGTDFVVEANP